MRQSKNEAPSSVLPVNSKLFFIKNDGKKGSIHLLLPGTVQSLINESITILLGELTAERSENYCSDENCAHDEAGLGN
jgi:hypothetical protein